MILVPTLLATISIATYSPPADTLHFSCSAAPASLPTAAAAGRYVIRNAFDGNVFESSDHTIAFRDSVASGQPLLIWQGEWRHRRDNRSTDETIVLCRNGLAPVAMTISPRAGTVHVTFNGRVVQWRQANGPVSTDTLPEIAFPRESQHLLAAVLAAGGPRTLIAPMYRAEAEGPAGRFAYASIEVRPTVNGITPVHITAFGGTLEYEVDLAAQQVKIVRLALTMGIIEEVRL
jgi:hypothetical protein